MDDKLHKKYKQLLAKRVALFDQMLQLDEDDPELIKQMDELDTEIHELRDQAREASGR